MADIFLSYSRSDYALAARVVSYLEENGFTVWWDSALRAGEEFTDEIAKQIEQAKTVVVIWTNNSKESRFVLAEAKKADRDKKLIPIRSADLHPDDIPLPFNVLHTELAGKNSKLLERLVDSVENSHDRRRFAHFFQTHLFLYLGIFGSSLTILSFFDELVVLASWAKIFTDSWSTILAFIFQEIGNVLSIRIPHTIHGALSLVMFLLAFGISMALRVPMYLQVSKPSWIYLLAFYMSIFIAFFFPRSLSPLGPIDSFVFNVALASIICSFFLCLGLHGQLRRKAEFPFFMLYFFSFYLVSLSAVYIDFGSFGNYWVVAETEEGGLRVRAFISSNSRNFYIFSPPFFAVLCVLSVVIFPIRMLASRMLSTNMVVLTVLSLSQASKFLQNLR